MNLYSNKAQQGREPAEGQQKTKEKQEYACADRDVSRSRSGINFDIRLYDSWIGFRTGLKVSIPNENSVRTRSGITSLSFRIHVNTVLLNAELQEGE